MSYSQYMDKEEKAQEKQLEIERIQLALLKELSALGYVADDDVISMIDDIADLVVNDSLKARGFRKMSLAELGDSYDKSI
ncbi:hypothetical protein [Orbus hercynius]|nr:hypothetical protein [Orbus hercynius]